jgi:hypothetical protein
MRLPMLLRRRSFHRGCRARHGASRVDGPEDRPHLVLLWGLATRGRRWQCSRGGVRVGLRDLGIDREDPGALCACQRERLLSRPRRGSFRRRQRRPPSARPLVQGNRAGDPGPELWHELQQIETIQEVLDEGLRILSTPALRSAYEFNLAHGPDADGEPEDRGATPSPSPFPGVTACASSSSDPQNSRCRPSPPWPSTMRSWRSLPSPTGRLAEGRKLQPPAVKVLATGLGLRVLQPAKLRDGVVAKELASLPDLFVVVAYGRILPPDLLAVPRLGPWNVHASILPKFRGAAPIQWAVMRGEV